MSSLSEEPVPRTIIDIKLVTTFFVNELHLGETCHGTAMSWGGTVASWIVRSTPERAVHV